MHLSVHFGETSNPTSTNRDGGCNHAKNYQTAYLDKRNTKRRSLQRISKTVNTKVWKKHTGQNLSHWNCPLLSTDLQWDVIPQRRSVAKSAGCLQQHLFVFVCQHDNFRKSKHRMTKLGGRCIVQKSQQSLNLGVIAPWMRSPKNVALGYDVALI